MIAVAILEEENVAVLEPSGPLSRLDFEDVKSIIDPVIEEKGKLNGIIIHTREFPGWEDFAGLLSHLTFVHEHHDKVARVAIVTDSQISNFAERIASHFVNARIKSFKYDDIKDALDWVKQRA
jgi:hypothetical protein